MSTSTINRFLNEIGLTDIQKNDKFQNCRIKIK